MAQEQKYVCPFCAARREAAKAANREMVRSPAMMAAMAAYKEWEDAKKEASKNPAVAAAEEAYELAKWHESPDAPFDNQCIKDARDACEAARVEIPEYKAARDAARKHFHQPLHGRHKNPA